MVEAVPEESNTTQEQAAENVGPPREHDPVMRGMFPNRNTYTFENGVRITSEFEAGNLWRCLEFAAEAANEVEPPADDEEVEKDEAAEETKNESPDGAEETKDG